MRHNLFGPPDFSWIFEEFSQRSEEEQEQFRQLFYEKMLKASTPQEVAQKAFGVNTPVEVALKALETKEQRRELMARLQQMSS